MKNTLLIFRSAISAIIALSASLSYAQTIIDTETQPVSNKEIIITEEQNYAQNWKPIPSPETCKYPYQGKQIIPNTIGYIDCNVSSAAFPGETTSDRCMKIDYPNYSGNGLYRVINNNTNETLFIPLKTVAEWEAFSSATSQTANQYTVDTQCNIKGICGIATASQTASAQPMSSQLCQQGKATTPTIIRDANTHLTSWSWKCLGTPPYIGNDVNCNTIAANVATGVCGPANNVYLENIPTTGLCDVGDATEVQKIVKIIIGLDGNTSESFWTWKCLSTPPDLEAPTNCNTIPKPKTNGVCGAINGTAIDKEPTYNDLCNVGVPDLYNMNKNTNGEQSWSWVCKSEDGGNQASCSASLRNINAKCSTAMTSGIPLATAPTTGLCEGSLTSSPVSENPYTFIWTCYGQGSGQDSLCIIAKLIKEDGQCGAISGTVNADPTIDRTGMCKKGTIANVHYNRVTLNWDWVCMGTNGGNNSPLCTAIGKKGCGYLNGQSVNSSLDSSTVGLCAYAYTPSNVSPNVMTPPHLHFTWTWTCGGTSNSNEPGVQYSCTATGTTGCPFSGGVGANPCNYPDP